jgi:endonuclease/exonuclease/phosphatase family metal-dependent hydrolase
MRLKLLNLNIYGGKYYDNLISFIKTNDFDIVCLQEVRGGNYSFAKTDIFKKLQEDLQMEAEFALTTNLKEDKSSCDGNAIYYKKSLKAKNKQIISLYPYKETEPTETDFTTYPRNALSLDFEINGKTLSIINTQLSWNKIPKETAIQTRVGQKLLSFIKGIKNEYILVGDFNLEATSRMVSKFNAILRNLTLENKITNTLNPRTHRAQILFPKGLAVDFIFTTPTLKITDFKLVDSLDLSDHFGLSLIFEF